MTLDYAEQSNEQLTDLLSYPDMRIRKRAQFQLVKNGSDGFKALKETALKGKNQLPVFTLYGGESDKKQLRDSKMHRCSPNYCPTATPKSLRRPLKYWVT